MSCERLVFLDNDETHPMRTTRNTHNSDTTTTTHSPLIARRPGTAFALLLVSDGNRIRIPDNSSDEQTHHHRQSARVVHELCERRVPSVEYRRPNPCIHADLRNY